MREKTGRGRTDSAATSPLQQKLEQGDEIDCRGNADKHDAYLRSYLGLIVSVSVRVVVMLFMSTHGAFLLGAFFISSATETVAAARYDYTFFKV